MNFRNIVSKFNEMLFPDHIKCIVCGVDLKEQNIYDLCEHCKHKITLNNGKTCTICGKPVFGGARVCPICKPTRREFDKALAPTIYCDDNANLIRQFKYHNKRYLAKTFANVMAEEYLKSSFDIDLVVPVPMFAQRQKERGYNQSQLLAEEFCKSLNLDLDTQSFVRQKFTEQQAGLSRRQREENLQGAFKVIMKNNIKGKNILLIDDVITTGATMNECALTLKKAGAKKVFCLAYAHTPTKLDILKQNILVRNAKSFDKINKILYNTQSTTRMKDDKLIQLHQHKKHIENK